MKVWKFEIKPGHFSANALALLLVALGALLLADYGYETGSMMRLAAAAVVTTILSILAFRYSQQDIPGLVASWAVIICAMVVLFVGWAAYTYEVPFSVETAVSYMVGPLSLVIFYVIFLYAAFFVYHNFIEEEEEEAPVVSPLVSRAGMAARRRMAADAEGASVEKKAGGAAPKKKAGAARAGLSEVKKPAAKKAPARKKAASRTKTPSRGKERKAAKKASSGKKKGSKK
jgi:hypothetical protein